MRAFMKMLLWLALALVGFSSAPTLANTAGDALGISSQTYAITHRHPWPALSTIRALIESGQNANLGIWTDSIGNEYNPAPGNDSARREWPYLLADKFAATYPAYTVQVIYWPLTSATAYTTPAMVIQTGTAGASAPVLTIYNFAVAGAPTMYGMGSSWQGALLYPPIDAMIISHGANHVYGMGTGGTTIDPTKDPVIRGEFIAALEQFKLNKPGVPVDWLRENPRRDDDLMIPVSNAQAWLSRVRDVGLIDVYSAFIAAGKPASWYQNTGVQANDNVHPDQQGEYVYLSVFWAAYQAAEPITYRGALSLFLPSPPNVNLVTNGNFSNWATSPGAPDGGWSLSGAGTLTAAKDATILSDNTLGYSVKLTSTGGASYLQQTLSSTIRNQFLGGNLTLVARRRINDASGTVTTLGQVYLYVSSTANGVTLYGSRPFTTRADGWEYIVISGAPIPTDCNSLAVRIYHDNEATPAATQVNFDFVMLTSGFLPAAAR